MKKHLPIEEIIHSLKSTYPTAHCSLEFKNPFQLLIATILSAQCTDERVNRVTPTLFKRYPDPQSLSEAPIVEIERIIASTGFYRNKARSLNGASKKIVDEFQGRVPKTMEELVALPGVGRKTANVVLGNAFGIASGVVVDTHVKRLSFRLGLTKETNPEKIEKVLNRIVPSAYWIQLPHWLIAHGRAICRAQKPRCAECTMKLLCPQKGVSKPKEKPKRLTSFSV